ncbi:MAG: hypothetical protein L0387_00635 [Acidobacteria bacterium]|nr:hypothetical protein [Acidobacteriota bacterium]MCI0720311.1 hypothetical protein [Acidobacteriota bacterium]
MQKTDFNEGITQLLPRDKDNAKLLSNVHLTHWKNPEPASRYNLVVIGAGTAGLVSTAAAAELGSRFRALPTGDCRKEARTAEGAASLSCGVWFGAPRSAWRCPVRSSVRSALCRENH